MSIPMFFEVFLIAIGVSMDAFAVAICKGLSFKEYNKKNALIVALYFGFFQALMPLIGYLLGIRFQDSISDVSHWIAFVLLAAIGLNLIKEGMESDSCGGVDSLEKIPCSTSNRTLGSARFVAEGSGELSMDNPLCFKSMSLLAIATSIDALAVGVTFAFLKINIMLSILIIGIVTFVLSYIGVKIGNVFGAKYKSKAEIFGGIILIIMAFNILFDHFDFINF